MEVKLIENNEIKTGLRWKHLDKLKLNCKLCDKWETKLEIWIQQTLFKMYILKVSRTENIKTESGIQIKKLIENWIYMLI